MKIHFIWLVASIIGIATATPLPRQNVDATYFFTFGNSYTDTTFSPNKTAPSASNPMGNPSLGTGTTAGGTNWVGYLTATQNASLVLSYNLAVGGATIDNTLVSGNPKDLVSQFDVFQSTYADKDAAGWTGENAIFAVWIGINDIGNAYSNTDAETFTSKLIARYRSLVEKIYRDGGRKFLFLNVPAVSRTPEIQSQGKEAAKSHAKYLSVFNENVESMVKNFTTSHKDTTTVLYDSWSFMTKVLDKPQSYGFPNATCVNDDGHSCIWWNSYHPTSKYHQLQADDMKAHLEPLGAW
ncbi:SGNH/GDSL hydrolase family protein [Aspergillus ruber CBS 135680]|uniref:Cellulose-binding GDSL lipase/acylhydrolase n=1 Tax=Aspergillus ruber (strain CBS 135680) TaxID=1388766 RepID=A0A017SCS3_ASPRC|nr:cellulose-binding GDSL lipase/acylhydrolase [Aspergillus ruber CBS 135680]EYE94848.1 cellulose-binding GDSL lipase/acylhydrolase [Aspergillus ruber CBS 135680]